MVDFLEDGRRINDIVIFAQERLALGRVHGVAAEHAARAFLSPDAPDPTRLWINAAFWMLSGRYAAFDGTDCPPFGQLIDFLAREYTVRGTAGCEDSDCTKRRAANVALPWRDGGPLKTTGSLESHRWLYAVAALILAENRFGFDTSPIVLASEQLGFELQERRGEEIVIPRIREIAWLRNDDFPAERRNWLLDFTRCLIAARETLGVYDFDVARLGPILAELDSENSDGARRGVAKDRFPQYVVRNVRSASEGRWGLASLQPSIFHIVRTVGLPVPAIKGISLPPNAPPPGEGGGLTAGLAAHELCEVYEKTGGDDKLAARTVIDHAGAACAAAERAGLDAREFQSAVRAVLAELERDADPIAPLVSRVLDDAWSAPAAKPAPAKMRSRWWERVLRYFDPRGMILIAAAASLVLAIVLAPSGRHSTLTPKGALYHAEIQLGDEQRPCGPHAGSNAPCLWRVKNELLAVFFRMSEGAQPVVPIVLTFDAAGDYDVLRAEPRAPIADTSTCPRGWCTAVSGTYEVPRGTARLWVLFAAGADMTWHKKLPPNASAEDLKAAASRAMGDGWLRELVEFRLEVR